MSKTKRPPELLRKSHAHIEVDERARAKRELLDALEDALEDDQVDDADDRSESDDGGDGGGPAAS